MKDFYYILGTDTGSSSVDIKEAYEKLSRIFHPDLNPGDPYIEGRYWEIREAYETLGQADKRNQYDKELQKLRDYTTNGPRKPKYQAASKGINVVFTLALFALTLIFGNYVIKAMSSTKAPKPVASAPVASIAPKPVISLHHKRHHHFKNRLYSALTHVGVTPVKHAAALPILPAPVASKPAAVSPAIVTTKPAVAANTLPVSKATPPPAPVPAVKQAPVPAPRVATQPNYLYAAHLKSNETGVVNMRKFDTYNADVIKVIPSEAKVFVLEEGNAYCKVLFDHQTGYVPKWTIQPQ